MIQSLKVKGLNGRFDYDLIFYEDINLFTGHIGTGKTTLLKLIWFLTSGNLHRVISEIPFHAVSIETSNFSLSMEMNQDNTEQVLLVWNFADDEEKSEVDLQLVREPSKPVKLKQEDDVHKLNEQIANVTQSSLFFPTFRRMERHFGWEILGEALSKLASEMSVGDHKFIAAVSTYDLIELLKEKHTEIFESTNRDDEDYRTLCERWSKLQEIIKEIFQKYYGGIQITDNLTLPCDPDNKDIISSANLSSGEKQLLGFLCYNAFSEARTIFIDEPELSLHADWRRLLLRLLMIQGTDKQFFVSTHSTIHIVSKHPEKQHILLRREGDN